MTDDGSVVEADEVLDQPGPASGRYACPGRRGERRSGTGIAHESGHVASEGASVCDVEEQARAAVLDQVERAPDRRCHNRDAAGLGLLDGLAERLGLTGMDEDVQGCEGSCQLQALELPREAGPWQQLAQSSRLRPVADDNELDIGQPSQLRQTVDLLLRRQAADVANRDSRALGDPDPLST
jgi:hypothetical protein